MQDFILNHYMTFKALHIISVIAWMAGLLYLPRLFVYHAGVATGSESSEIFKLMERRLYEYIMVPAMISAWFFGLCLFLSNFDSLKVQGWMHVKILLIVLLTGAHHIFGAWRKKFARDENTKPAKFFRIWNEIPTLLMIVIVILAVVKPF